MEIILTTFIVFIFGCVLGSFLCVCIDRLPKGLSVISGHSMCEHCGKTLGPRELIPVVSYIALSGKCSFCHAKIPAHVFITETFSGILAVGLYLYTQYTAAPLLFFVFLFIIMLCLLGILLSDSYSGIIPDEFLVIAGIATLASLVFFSPQILTQNIIVAIASFAVFLALFIATRGRGMGFGDVKFAAVIGLFLGFPNIIIGFYVSFLTGAAISLILILAGKKKLRGDTIPFGPFLVIGTVVAYFFGTKILAMFIK